MFFILIGRLFSTLMFSFSVVLFLIWAPLVAVATGDQSSESFGLLQAVQQTLSLQPEIAFEKETINFRRGALQSEAGDFDAQFQADLRFERDNVTDTSAFSEVDSDTSTLSFGVVKKLRNGVELAPALVLEKTDYRAGSDEDSLSQGRLQFQVTVPLLNGAGRTSVAASEIVAGYELAASQADLGQQISISVRDTLLNYWALLSSCQRLEIFQQSELRARLLADQTRALIQAEQLPASDLQNVLANLADKGSLLIAAQQCLIESRFALGVAIGLSAIDAAALPLPADDFSCLSLSDIATLSTQSSAYLSLAENNRCDLLALAQRRQGLQTLIDSSRNQLQPTLNIDAMAGYDGFTSGDGRSKTVDALGYRQQGLDWSLGMTLEYPLENQRAKGQHAQSLASFRQNQIETSNLKRTIFCNVMVDVNNLQHVSAEQLKADVAVENYQQAVENERQRFMLGEVTLLNLLDIQDRLDSALLNQISTRLKLAQAMTALRFETGTLLNNNGFAPDGEDGQEFSIELADLVTVPRPAN